VRLTPAEVDALAEDARCRGLTVVDLTAAPDTLALLPGEKALTDER
jgi:hypothetical protein